MNFNFECQGTGKCCVSRGDVGFVFLTALDRLRLATFTGKPVAEFAEEAWFDYTRFSKGKTKQWFLIGGEKQCRFLEGGKCSVYEARPTQCRTWPYWPEHMNEKSWKAVAKFCPGVGKGTDHSDSNLSAQRAADLEHKRK